MRRGAGTVFPCGFILGLVLLCRAVRLIVLAVGVTCTCCGFPELFCKFCFIGRFSGTLKNKRSFLFKNYIFFLDIIVSLKTIFF